MTTKSLLALFLPFLICYCHAQNWDGIGVGMDGGVRCFGIDETTNTLIVGGNFKNANQNEVNGIAAFVDSEFTSIGEGETNCFNMCNPVLSIITYNGKLYAGGHLLEMGFNVVGGISNWNGEAWNSMGMGVNGYVSSLLNINEILIVGGSFDSAGFISANGLAIWNDTSWYDLGHFPNTWGASENWMNVGSIVSYQSNLYVGGLFPEGSGISHSIARWDGLAWGTVGTSIGGVDVWINDMIIFQDELYVAGYFFKEHGNHSSGIMKWNGGEWSGIGSGVNFGSQVFDLEIYQGYLYACGNFISMSGVVADKIAKWDGTEWCGLGSTINNSISCMTVFQDELYIGGGFTVIDGDTINRIAKWVGGEFVDTCGSDLSVLEEQNTYGILVTPNPTTSHLRIQCEKPMGQLTVTDAMGRVVLIKSLEPQTTNYEFETSSLAPGLYVLRAETESGWRSSRFVRE